MLLRRITQHVKEQNWFAVALDFFIVVAGILIAFQITEWNERRVDKQRERVLLQRLQLDFEGIVSWGENIMPTVVSMPDDTKRLIEQIRADDKPEMDDAFRRSAKASIYGFAYFETSPTYQELVSTGTLSRITNPELRDTLANYGRSVAAEVSTTKGLYEIQNRDVMRKAIKFQTHSADIDTVEKSTTDVWEDSIEIAIANSFDWEALKMTEPHLHVVLQNQLYVLGWKQTTFNEAKKALRILNEELGLESQAATKEIE